MKQLKEFKKGKLKNEWEKTFLWIDRQMTHESIVGRAAHEAFTEIREALEKK